MQYKLSSASPWTWDWPGSGTKITIEWKKIASWKTRMPLQLSGIQQEKYMQPDRPLHRPSRQATFSPAGKGMTFSLWRVSGCAVIPQRKASFSCMSIAVSLTICYENYILNGVRPFGQWSIDRAGRCRLVPCAPGWKRDRSCCQLTASSKSESWFLLSPLPPCKRKTPLGIAKAFGLRHGRLRLWKALPLCCFPSYLQKPRKFLYFWKGA